MITTQQTLHLKALVKHDRLEQIWLCQNVPLSEETRREPIILMMPLYRKVNNKVQLHTEDTDIVSGKERSLAIMCSSKKEI